MKINSLNFFLENSVVEACMAQMALKKWRLVMCGIILIKCQNPVKQLKISSLGKMFKLHGNVFISLAGTQEHTQTCQAVSVNPVECCQSCALQVARTWRWSEASCCMPCLLWAVVPCTTLCFCVTLEKHDESTSASVYLEECSSDLQGSKCKRSQVRSHTVLHFCYVDSTCKCHHFGNSFSHLWNYWASG